MRGRYRACHDAGMTHLAAFLGVAIVVIITPGQDTALTIPNALAGGARSGVFTAFGVATGQAVWTLCTSLGLAALLLASEPAFVALKIAGAAYLIWLGIQSAPPPSRSRAPSTTGPGPRRSRNAPHKAPFRAKRTRPVPGTVPSVSRIRP
jgi:threonine/homoserine/homoserine lactone efflux protein